MHCDRLLSGVIVVSLSFAVAGCQENPHYQINRPVDQSSIACTDPAGVNCQVPIEVQWEGVSVRPHPEVALDNAPLTVLFNDTGNSSAAILTTGLGAHTLVVSGDLTAKGSIATYSAQSAFTVTAQLPPTGGPGGFSVSAAPSDLLVERGKSATTTVTITRIAPFAGAVTLAISAPPTGIAAPSVTIPAGTSTGTITISASAAAVHGKPMLPLTGTSSGVANAGTPLKLTVGRETGTFQEANPTPYQSNVPQTKTALAGGFRVDIAAGGTTLPQPRKATFFRGTQAVGNEIGFTLGPNSTLGGAGFCANTAPVAITRGVVLSGAMPSYPSQNVVTLLDLTATAPQLIEVPTDMTVQRTGGPLISFQPRVFFSRDCTVALVAGANKLGPSNHILRVYDLNSGQPIGAEVTFDTPVFSALLRNAGAKQEVEIKVDVGGTNPQTVVRAIP